MLLDPVPQNEMGALIEADLDGLPREALVASIHYLAEELASIAELCQRMSPSAIPDLRGRANIVRAAEKVRGLNPVYGLDSLCDYLEAIFYKIGVGGCGNKVDFNWKIYDDLRRTDPDWTCWVENCPLMAEFHAATCIVHRGMRKDDDA